MLVHNPCTILQLFGVENDNLTSSADGTMFVLIGRGHIGDRHFVDTSLVASRTGGTIVTEHDVSNTPLIEVLLETDRGRGASTSDPSSYAASTQGGPS